MKNLIRNTLFVLLTLNFAAQAQAHEPPAPASSLVSMQLQVTGKVEHKLILNVADLQQFPPQRIGELALVCQSGANLGKLERLKGVLLKDILEKAKIIAPGHNDLKRMVIIARATDGYQVVFSWNELFNSQIGEGVLVFYERDGKPLLENEAQMALISAKDTRTGPRHVKWLKEIEIQQIGE